MGHLMTQPYYSDLPNDIYNFVHRKSRNKIVNAYNDIGCCFYILKSGLLDKWTYNYNGNIINIDYSKLDKFNPSRMKYITRICNPENYSKSTKYNFEENNSKPMPWENADFSKLTNLNADTDYNKQYNTIVNNSS